MRRRESLRGPDAGDAAGNSPQNADSTTQTPPVKGGDLSRHAPEGARPAPEPAELTDSTDQEPDDSRPKGDGPIRCDTCGGPVRYGGFGDGASSPGTYSLEIHGVRIEIDPDALLEALTEHLVHDIETPVKEDLFAKPEPARALAVQQYRRMLDPILVAFSKGAAAHLRQYGEILLDIYADTVFGEVYACAAVATTSSELPARLKFGEGRMLKGVLARLEAHLRNVLHVRRGGRHPLPGRKGYAHLKSYARKALADRYLQLHTPWKRAAKDGEFPTAAIASLPLSAKRGLREAFDRRADDSSRRKITPQHLAVLQAAAEQNIWAGQEPLPYETLVRMIRPLVRAQGKAK